MTGCRLSLARDEASYIGYELFGRLAPGADAVRHANAAISIPRKREAGQLLAQSFDAIETVEMSDAVLRHRRLPSVDARKQRLGAQAGDLRTQNLLQFVAHDSDNLLVAQRPDTLRILSRKKTTQQGAVFRSAMRKFVVHESRGQQLLAFAPRNQKSESGRQRLPHFTIVAESNGDGGTVLDRSELGGKLRDSRCAALARLRPQAAQ